MGEFHRVAFGVLVSDGRALLCHRHPGRRLFPDVWDLPGGHIEGDETPDEAVRRELSEELGVRVLELVRLSTPVRVAKAETHVFAVTRWEGHPENLAPDEHDEVRWVSPSAVDDLKLAVPEVAALVREAVLAVSH